MTYSNKLHPFKQLFYILSLFLFVNVLTFFIRKFDPTILHLDAYWVNALAMSFLFIIINCLIMVRVEDLNNYWWQSLISYVVLALICGSVAWIWSGLTVDEAGPIRWMYFVFTFGYIILLAIIRTMKWLMAIAENEDARLRGEK